MRWEALGLLAYFSVNLASTVWLRWFRRDLAVCLVSKVPRLVPWVLATAMTTGVPVWLIVRLGS